MKFAVMMSAKETTTSSVPVSVVRAIWTEFHDVMNRQKTEGIVQEVHCIPGREWQFLAIYVVGSFEELWDRLNELPAAGGFDFDSYPLADFDEAIKVIFRNMEKAEDKFSDGTLK